MTTIRTAAAAATWALAAGAALAQPANPPAPSPALGWRVFQQHCARCHGSDAGGTADAPNLVERVGAMGETRFAGTVLRRYQWLLPADEAGREGGAREALIEDIARGRAGRVQMPAWEGRPAVEAHVRDVHAWLQARAAGTMPPGPPPSR